VSRGVLCVGGVSFGLCGSLRAVFHDVELLCAEWWPAYLQSSSWSRNMRLSHILCAITVFWKLFHLWDNVEKYFRPGQATDDNTAHVCWMLGTQRSLVCAGSVGVGCPLGSLCCDCGSSHYFTILMLITSVTMYYHVLPSVFHAEPDHLHSQGRTAWNTLGNTW
jgi:hypothetical protein